MRPLGARAVFREALKQPLMLSLTPALAIYRVGGDSIRHAIQDPDRLFELKLGLLLDLMVGRP